MTSSNERVYVLPRLLREAERRVNRHCWPKADESRPGLVQIPANRDQDVDLLLMEAADVIEALTRPADDGKA